MAGVLAWRMRESAKAMARTWKSLLLARISDKNVGLKAAVLEAENAYSLIAKVLLECLRELVTLCDVLNGANEHIDGVLEVFQRCRRLAHSRRAFGSRRGAFIHVSRLEARVNAGRRF